MHWRIENNKYVYRYRTAEGKNRRVPIDSYAQPRNEKEANSTLNILESKYDEGKIREKEQRAWHEKYYNFIDLVSIFDSIRSKEAPNSWESKKHWFGYVLHYFLNIKQIPNLNEWKYHFEDFKEHLLTVSPVRFKSKKVLSYASKNHVINELNCFMKIMAKRHKCDQQPKLETFSAKLVDNFKDAESIVDDTEFITVYNSFNLIDKDHAAFYYLLKETGMRFNELRGISLNDVRSGLPPEDAMVRLFNSGGIKSKDIKGYIVLRHQPVIRKPRGSVEYKALKSKPKISNKFNRYIPIINKKAWDVIKEQVKKTRPLYEKEEYGKSLDNYCFWFDSVTKNTFSSRLKKAYTDTAYKYKSAHCLRHTRATELARLDFTEQLAKMILGHTSKTTQRYIHLNDMMEKSEKVGEFSFEDFE